MSVLGGPSSVGPSRSSSDVPLCAMAALFNVDIVSFNARVAEERRPLICYGRQRMSSTGRALAQRMAPTSLLEIDQRLHHPIDIPLLFVEWNGYADRRGHYAAYVPHEPLEWEPPAWLAAVQPPPKRKVRAATTGASSRKGYGGGGSDGGESGASDDDDTSDTSSSESDGEGDAHPDLNSTDLSGVRSAWLPDEEAPPDWLDMTKVRELEHAIERLADDMEAASDGEEEPPAPSPSTAGPSTSAPSTAPETPTPSPAAPPATAIERLADDMEAASDGEEEPPAPSPSAAGPSTSAPSTAPETPTPSPAAPPATAESGAPTGGAGKRRSTQTRASPKLRLPGARGYAFKRTVVAEFNRIKQGSRLSRDRLERIRTAAQVEAKRALADADEKSGNYLRPGGDFAMAFQEAGGRYVWWIDRCNQLFRRRPRGSPTELREPVSLDDLPEDVLLSASWYGARDKTRLRHAVSIPLTRSPTVSSGRSSTTSDPRASSTMPARRCIASPTPVKLLQRLMQRCCRRLLPSRPASAHAARRPRR